LTFSDTEQLQTAPGAASISLDRLAIEAVLRDAGGILKRRGIGGSAAAKQYQNGD
jgi:hypothetical protein